MLTKALVFNYNLLNVFDHNSNPTTEGGAIEFKTLGSKQLNYFDITNDGIFARILNRNRTNFWDDIFNEYKQYWDTQFDFQSV